MSCFWSFLLSGWPPTGRFRLIPCSRSGVVITKMMSKTNAKSSKGVILMSDKVTSELRWEKRLIFRMLQVAGCRLQVEGPGRADFPNLQLSICNFQLSRSFILLLFQI